MAVPPPGSRKVRKHLSADALYGLIHEGFGKIPDHRDPKSAIPFHPCWNCHRGDSLRVAAVQWQTGLRGRVHPSICKLPVLSTLALFSWSSPRNCPNRFPWADCPQNQHHTGNCWHRVPFEVTEPKAPFDDFGTLFDRGADSGRFFAAKRPFAATPEERLPMLAVLVTLDPTVDRPSRHLAFTLGIIELQTSRDLLRRPVPCHAMTNALIDLRLVHLSRDRSLLPTTRGALLGLCG